MAVPETFGHSCEHGTADILLTTDIQFLDIATLPDIKAVRSQTV